MSPHSFFVCQKAISVPFESREITQKGLDLNQKASLESVFFVRHAFDEMSRQRKKI